MSDDKCDTTCSKSNYLQHTKLLKYKFILFLKQFKINEVKILMQFIELLLKEYQENSEKIFKLLRPEKGEEDDDVDVDVNVDDAEQEDCEEERESSENMNSDNLPRILKVESLSSLIQSPPSSQTSSNEEMPKSFSKVLSERLPSGFVTPRQSKKYRSNHEDELFNEEEYEFDEDEIDDYMEEDDEDETFDELNEDEEEDDDEEEEEEDHTMDLYDDDFDVQHERNQRVRKFSESIRDELEKEFQKSKFISGQDKIDLAKRLRLTVRQVQKWFVHRREKLRKLERQARQRLASEKNDFIENRSFDDDQDVSPYTKPQQRRGAFTPEVTKCLEKIFAKRQYLQPNEIQELAQAVDLTPKQIKSWFKNRRQRTKGDYVLRRTYDTSQTVTSSLTPGGSYPKEVLEELERAFLKDKYISGFDKKNLAQRVNLKPIQIERWFYYQRKKMSSSH